MDNLFNLKVGSAITWMVREVEDPYWGTNEDPWFHSIGIIVSIDKQGYFMIQLNDDQGFQNTLTRSPSSSIFPAP